MGDAALDRSGLAESTGRWVAAGLITSVQRDAVLDFERTTAPATIAAPTVAAPGPAEAAGSKRTIPVLVEIAGYAGIAILLAATSFVLGTYWADLADWARLLLTATITLLLAGAATTISWQADRAVARLANFLWFLATVGVALFVGLLNETTLHLDSMEAVLLTAGVTAVPATFLLWWRRAPLQHLAEFASLASILLAGIDLATDGFATAALTGMVFWGLGGIWCLLSWGGLLPSPNVGYTLGSLTLLIAPIAVSVTYPDAGIWLAIFTALALLAAGAALRSLALVGLAIPGVFASITAALERYVGFEGDSGVFATLVLLLLGAAILVGALVTARRLGQQRARPGGHRSPRGERHAY